MLARDQADRLRALGLHTMHDHWFSSLLYGEPFLSGDLAAYFDGRGLMLCAFPLRGRPLPSRGEIAAWTQGWVRETEADYVVLVTPYCPDLRALRSCGLERFHTWPARRVSRELIAPCPQSAESGQCPRRLRRGLQAAFEARITTGGSMDAAKLALIEQFQRTIGSTPYLAGLTTAWPAILTRERVQFIEAWDTRGLRGFIAMHQAFEQGAVAVAMARDRDAAGVTDFLYAHMLLQARKLGCDWVNLGSCVTEGQYRFKQKWASPSVLPAYALTEWRRRSVARRRFNLWGPRTMKKSAS